MLLVYIQFGVVQAQPVLKTNAAIDVYPLDQYLAYYTDSTNSLGIDLIRKINSAGKFVHNTHGYPNFGVSKSNHWYFFALENNDVESDLIMDIPDSYLEKIELFVYGNNVLNYHIRTNGWRTPINERPVSSYHHAFPIRLQGKGVYQVFIKIQRQTGTVKGTVLLETKNHYYRNYIFENHISSLVQGSILLLSLFGFSLFLLTTDRLYLWYFLQNVALLLFISARHGVLNFYLLGRWDLLAGNYANYICALLYASTHLFFVLNFLQIKTMMGNWFYRISVTLIWFQIFLLLILNFQGLESAKFYLMYACVIATSLLVASIIIVGLWQRTKNIRIYAFAQAPFLILIIYYMIGLFIPVPVNWISIHGLQFGPLFEVTVLAVALADRFSGFQRQNYVLLNNLNEAQTQIIAIQDIERQRIAQDLHDELGGNLAAIKMSLQSAAIAKSEVLPILKLIDQISVNTRNIAHNLMPPEFEETNLPELITNHIFKLNLEEKIQFSFHNSGYNGTMFTKQHELTLYRIIMELVNNVMTHAHASEATIQLIGYENYLELMIEDDGQGFETTVQKGIGLKSIGSRVNF